MSDRSKIEWTDASWNPLVAYGERLTADAIGYEQHRGWHCEHVTEACRNCYAEGMNRRLGTGRPFKPGERANITLGLDEKTLLQPLRWKKPRKIFPCSMTDLFGDWVTDEQLDRIFAVMALCPQHTFIVLTKRPERMREYLGACVSERGRPLVGIATGRGPEMLTAKPGLALDAATFAPKPLPNVWLLVSICDQPDADKFIPVLLDTPAAVRGVSYEPALGPVDFTEITDRSVLAPPSAAFGERHFSALPNPDDEPGAAYLDWLICGGESGPNARPMHPDWARQAQRQCEAAGVPFFFKQHGEWLATCDDEGQISYATDRVHGWEGVFAYRVGKKRAGRLLDGVEHNGFPA